MSSTPGAFPPWPGDIAGWLARWYAPFAGPQQLSQPILPGWTLAPALTINAGNSSAPQTEAEIVQLHSYGRQLGRISEALEALIEQRPDGAPADQRLEKFLEMTREIEQVKLDAAVRRLERVRADLAVLKDERPEEYEQLRGALRSVLDD